MKTQHVVSFVVAVLGASALSACGGTAPAFLEVTATGGAFAATSKSENDSLAKTVGETIGGSKTSNENTNVNEITSSAAAVEFVTGSDSVSSTATESVSAAVTESVSAAVTESVSATVTESVSANAPDTVSTTVTEFVPPAEPVNYHPNDESMAVCLQQWASDTTLLPTAYSLVQAKNTNNSVIFSDNATGQVAHRVDIVTKNANKGVVELLNPDAAYCVRHDGWNANKLTVRVACTARIVELDANLHIAHRLVVERVGCK